MTPASVTVDPGATTSFQAVGDYSDGSHGAVGAHFIATGGTVNDSGAYTAAARAGLYLVIATSVTGGLSDTAIVTVRDTSTVILPYQTIARMDWNDFLDDAALKSAGLIGPESDALLQQPPALRITDLYELAPDPLWGKVVRYKGGTFANPSSTSLPPRVPVHVVRFPEIDDIWVRQYVRFSPNWTTLGTNPPGGTSYKAMFIRWKDVGFRMGWLINGSRDMIMEHGQAINGANFANTSVKLLWDNHTPVSPIDGAYGVDAKPMLKVYPLSGPPLLEGGDGTNEWWEVVMHHRKVSAQTAQGTLAFRQYTANGAVSPGPWKIIARETTFLTEYWRPAVAYQMGVNRNKWFDESMHIDWGPYEVVDGARFPNPWRLPGN